LSSSILNRFELIKAISTPEKKALKSKANNINTNELIYYLPNFLSAIFCVQDTIEMRELSL